MLAGAVAAASLPAQLFGRPPAAVKRRRVTYTVKRGDTLSKIARKHRVTIQQIKRWNRLKGDFIREGDRLRLAPPVSPSGRPELTDPVQVPPGEGYLLKQPDESWGTAHAVTTLVAALEAFHAQHPDSVPIVVGDLSRKEGGYFPPHVSHRDGRDVDIGLPIRGNRRAEHFVRLRERDLDVKKSLDLIEALLDTGAVELILLHRVHQRSLYREAERRGYSKARLSRLFQWPRPNRVRVALIRHSRGHDDHMHVRFKKPGAPPPVADAPSEPAASPSAAAPVKPGPDVVPTEPASLTAPAE